MFPTLITMDKTVYSGLLSWFDYTGYDCLQWIFVLVWLHWLWLFTVDFCLGFINLVMTVYSGLLSWFDYTGYDCLQWIFVWVWLHWLCLLTVDFYLGLITLFMTVYSGLWILVWLHSGHGEIHWKEPGLSHPCHVLRGCERSETLVNYDKVHKLFWN